MSLELLMHARFDQQSHGVPRRGSRPGYRLHKKLPPTGPLLRGSRPESMTQVGGDCGLMFSFSDDGKGINLKGHAIDVITDITDSVFISASLDEYRKHLKSVRLLLDELVSNHNHPSADLLTNLDKTFPAHEADRCNGTRSA